MLQTKILSIIDYISPMKKIRVKQDINQFPWFDYELKACQRNKLLLYQIWKDSGLKIDEENFKFARNYFKKLQKKKLIEFFQNKKQSDFKNSKLFWSYYKSTIKMKSDNSHLQLSNAIIVNNKRITDQKNIADEFNKFFTNLTSQSKKAFLDTENIFKDKLDNLKRFNNENNFKFTFRFITKKEIIQYIHEIDSSSSPGISKIPIKIIKNSLNLFLPLLYNLFNTCIINKQVPDEWKFSIVKPLFKGKGSEMDINNYRGISILPPCKAIRITNCSSD